jgi:hypothetical protein
LLPLLPGAAPRLAEDMFGRNGELSFVIRLTRR